MEKSKIKRNTSGLGGRGDGDADSWGNDFGRQLCKENVACVLIPKNIMAQKRCVLMIYLCTFSNIILFTSRDKDESPYSSRLREGFKYRETTFINSVRCAS